MSSTPFYVALCITLFLELFVAAVFLQFQNIWKWRYCFPIVAVNLITLPIVWSIFPRLPMGGYLVIPLAELFAFIAEMLILSVFLKLPVKTTAQLSFVMNLSSFLLGPYVEIGFYRIAALVRN